MSLPGLTRQPIFLAKKIDARVKPAHDSKAHDSKRVPMEKLIITVACDSRTSYPHNHLCPPQEDIRGVAQQHARPHAAPVSGTPLRKRRLGASALDVSIVGLGGNNFGGRIDFAATCR